MNKTNPTDTGAIKIDLNTCKILFCVDSTPQPAP